MADIQSGAQYLVLVALSWLAPLSLNDTLMPPGGQGEMK
jgi:hypothetical protein